MKVIMRLKLTQLLRIGIRKRNYHTTKCLSEFYETNDRDGYQKKTEEEKEWDKMSLKDKTLLEFNLYKEGIKEWAYDLKETFVTGPRFHVNEHVVDVIWRFKGDAKELERWVITTDKDNNIGFSTAELDLTTDGKGLFHGYLDTNLPEDGKIKRTGYCNLRLIPDMTPFRNEKTYDWTLFSHLVLHVRGEGRTYLINLHYKSTFDVTKYDTFHYFLWTRGGPYWQHVRIPFSKFFFGYKGRLQSTSPPLCSNSIKAISITLADKISGPFALEIDYIGVEYDPSFKEECAYENYHIDQFLV